MSTTTTALVVLTGPMCRRLIGQGVAALPQVRHARDHGRLVIVGGTTTRFTALALTGEDPGRERFAAGWIINGALGETPKAGRGPGPLLFERGALSQGWPGPLLERFQAGDVYVKGANAIDPAGNAGILMASPTGGTIGAALAILHARGGELVIPASLQKLIPSVPAACARLGQGRVDRVMGSPVGMMPILAGSATLFTEVEALATLFGIQATPVAGGGCDDCEGAVTLHLCGPREKVDAAWGMIAALPRGDA